MAMRDYKFTLLANVPRTLNVLGNYFGVIEASGKIFIQFDDGVFIQRQEGMGGSADFQRVAIKSPIDQTVIISLGKGIMHDGRGTVSGFTVNASLTVANSSPVTPDVVLPALVTTEVITPNANRKKIILCAGEDNIENLRVGCHSSVGANNGGILAPGGSVELETVTGVWVYNPGDASESVTINEMEKI